MNKLCYITTNNDYFNYIAMIKLLILDTEGPYYSASLFDQNGPPKETVIVDAPKIIIMFEMENMDYHVPRLYIKSNINMELNDISSKVCIL